MERDPILTEVHALKDQLARESGYDFRVFCQKLREAETRYAKRLVRPSTGKRKGRVKAQG